MQVYWLWQYGSNAYNRQELENSRLVGRNGGVIKSSLVADGSPLPHREAYISVGEAFWRNLGNYYLTLQ